MSKKSNNKTSDNADSGGLIYSENRARLDRIRTVLHEQVCKQIRRQMVEMFDKLDDLLFAAPNSDNSSDKYNSLTVAREFRNKRIYFESSFLEALTAQLNSILYVADSPGHTYLTLAEPESEKSSIDSARLRIGEVEESLYEKMELDLAIQNIHRKAAKLYRPLNQQLLDIQNSQLALVHPATKDEKDLLVDIVSKVLEDLRRTFKVPLIVRLIFLKSFEQNVFLKMEMVYLGLISVLKNQEDDAFVDSYCNSEESYLYGRDLFSQHSTNDFQLGESEFKEQSKSEIIQTKVEASIKRICSQNDAPKFALDMIKNNWRDVLILLGFNQGVDSLEWKEALQAATNFLKLLNNSQLLRDEEGVAENLKDELSQGFELIQLPLSTKDSFFRKLVEHTALPHLDRTVMATRYTQSGEVKPDKPEKTDLKASISEAGRKILDDDDLEDIVALLSSDSTNEDQADEVDDSLHGYLSLVDKLSEGQEIEYVINGEVQKCRIQKSVTADNSYQITNRSGKVLLARSRVGLALCAKAGELRLGGEATLRPEQANRQTTLKPSQAHTNIDSPTAH